MFRTPQTKIEAKIVELSQNDLLKGRKALVTGGTSGIGFAIAKALIKSGASVCITSRDQQRIDSAVSELGSLVHNPNSIFGIVMDNRNVDEFERIVDEVNCRFGVSSFDILVNNAGVQMGVFGKTSVAQYDNVMDTNLKGAYFLSQCVAARMKANSIQGNILNIASASSLRPANSPYVMSKWGMKGLTLGLAKMLIPYGIVVNGIGPGATATPLLNKDKAEDDLSNPKNPLGRMTVPEEIADMAVILLSDIGRSVVGDIVYMTGGAGLLTFDDIPCNY